MEVRELIELLQKCPSDYDVLITSREEMGKSEEGGKEIDEIAVELILQAVSIIPEK